MHTIHEIVFIVARIMLASYFLLGAYNDIRMREDLLRLMERKKIPNFTILAYAAIALKIIAGLALVFNQYLPFAASALFIFTGIANVIFNDFWREETSKKLFMQTRFMVHVAVMGGLLLLTLH